MAPDARSTIGSRIRETRLARQLTQTELAHLIGEKSGRLISEWEHDTNAPGATKIGKLAEALGVSPNYLLDYYGGETVEISPLDGERLRKFHALDAPGRLAVDAILDAEYERIQTYGPADYFEQLAARPINLLSLPVSAGPGIELQDNYAEPISIPLTDTSKRADFVLRISGNSMEPEFSDGDLILIRQTPAVDPGMLGIFGLNGEGFFKKLGKDSLISLNSEYAPIPLNETFITFGEVLGKTYEI